MGKLTNLVSCLTVLVPLTVLAEEPRTFPTLKPIRILNLELRASTTKRGLAMLPTEPFPPRVHTVPEPLNSPAVKTINERDDVRYRGTVVNPKKDLEGDEARTQESFASRFPKTDPCPTARTAHFDWLPHYDDYPVRNLGWIAMVQRVERDRDGAWKVTVQLRPNLYSKSLMPYLWDYVEETYRLEGDSIRLIASDAEIPKPKAQLFPAAF